MRKEQLEMALEVAVNYIKTDKANMSPGSPAHMCVTSVLKRIDDILYPAPAYEEVPVERWAVVKSNGFPSAATYLTEQDAINAAERADLTDVVKLTGTLRRPLPRPVERSVSVKDIQINDIGHPRYNLSPMIVFPEAKGKVVTLTATWTEEGK